MTDTETGRALHRAILECPEEDVVRLVYADYLEENGEGDYAHFIRYEVGGFIQYRLTWDGALGLSLMFAKRTLGVPKQFPAGSVFTVGRGFVYRVEMPCAAFVEHAKSIFREHPVTEVVLSGRSPCHRSVRHRAEWGWCISDHANSDGRDDFWVPSYFAAHMTAPSTWGKHWLIYHSREDALTALSRACVSWGRSIAGLSSLPEPMEATS